MAAPAEKSRSPPPSTVDVEVEVGDLVARRPRWRSRTEASSVARTIVDTRFGGPWPRRRSKTAGSPTPTGRSRARPPGPRRARRRWRCTAPDGLRRRISSTGTLSRTPPSTSRSPLCGTGGSTPGMAMLARNGVAPAGRGRAPSSVGTGEVGRDAEVRHPEVGDVDVAEASLAACGDPPAAEERRGRAGCSRTGLGSSSSARSRWSPHPSPCAGPDGHDRADARAADHVDRLVEVLEHLEHAEVGEAAGAAPAEHEGRAGARQQPARRARSPSSPSPEVVVRRQRTRLEPAPGAGRQRRVRVVEQHEAHVLADAPGRPELSLVRARRRTRLGRRRRARRGPTSAAPGGSTPSTSSIGR